MRSPAIPNNLGPTLLLVLSLLLLPLGVGLPLMLVSLAQVRTWEGQAAFPRLHRGLGRLRSVTMRLGRLPPIPLG